MSGWFLDGRYQQAETEPLSTPQAALFLSEKRLEELVNDQGECVKGQRKSITVTKRGICGGLGKGSKDLK